MTVRTEGAGMDHLSCRRDPLARLRQAWDSYRTTLTSDDVALALVSFDLLLSSVHVLQAQCDTAFSSTSVH